MTFSGLPTFRRMSFLMIAKRGMTHSPQMSWDATNAYPILHDALQSRIDIVRESTGEELESLLAILSA